MDKIKVVFFIYQMGAGGAARTLLNIINNLNRERFIPVLVTLNYSGSYERELNQDVKLIKLDTKRLSRSAFKLAKVLRDERADIIFSTIPRVNTIAVLAKFLSLRKVKSIVREADNLNGEGINKIKLLLFGIVYKFSDQVISLSEGVKENLIKRYKVKKDDIKVIYNPVDINAIKEKIENSDINPKHKHLFNTQDKVIITAGRLVPQKDHKTLLNAFSMVNTKISSKLIVLGEGPLKQELVNQASDLKILDKVHFIGFQSNPYIYFKHADLFVLSSIHEGFSHVIAEALATETPVVSTNCKSGPEEVLGGGEYGYLCKVGNVQEMAEKILQVLRLSNSEINKLTSRGCKRAIHFEAGHIVRQYENMFNETLKP